MSATKTLRAAAVMVALVAIPLSARIAPEQITYLGTINPPAKQAGDLDWHGGANPFGVATVPDCMGMGDPSPGDDYPGCLLVYLSQTPERPVGLFDVVPPGKGLYATEIKVWSLFGQYPEETHPEWFARGLDRPYDLLYDNGPDGCRIWWTFVYYYANGMQIGTPFLGYSSCDPDNPNPQGMYAYDDSFHPNKASRSLSIVPERIADAHFGGQRFAITEGKGSGTRGSSGGPSAVVRDWTVPQGDISDYTPVLWYRAYGYPCWAETQDFRIPLTLPNGWDWEAPFSMCSRDSGGEFIDLDGEYTYVTSVPMPVYDPDTYPYDRNDTIYHQGDPSMPDLRTDPATGRPVDELAVTWYGADNELHKLTDVAKRIPPMDPPKPGRVCDPKAGMPGDPLIDSDCTGGRGPHCNNYHLYLLLYDVAEFSEAYRQEREEWETVPYSYVDITEHFGPCSHRLGGTAYEPSTRLLFLGGATEIHVWKVGEGGTPPDPCRDGVCREECPDNCVEPPDPCDLGCDPVECPELCEDEACDVIGGDTCLSDPTNCGPCPECPGGILSIDQEGNRALVECIQP